MITDNDEKLSLIKSQETFDGGGFDLFRRETGSLPLPEGGGSVLRTPSAERGYFCDVDILLFLRFILE